MAYKSPLTLEQKLRNIRQAYTEAKTQKGVNLTEQPYRISTFFGSTDFDTRTQQLALLEAIANIDNPFHKDNPRDALFDKYHLMVAMSYIIQQQIRGDSKVLPIGSTLYSLLDDALDINSQNQLDQHTINESLRKLARLDEGVINQFIRSSNIKGIKPLTGSEWDEYKRFATDLKKPLNGDNDSAITSTISTAGGLILAPVGWGVGFAVGQTIGSSGLSSSLSSLLEGTIRSTLILLGSLTGSGGAAAATLLAPSHGRSSAEYALGYTGAQFGAQAMRKTGQGLGWVVGKGLDLALSGAKDASSHAIGLLSKGGSRVELDVSIGLDLVHQELVANSKSLSQEEFIERISQVINDKPQQAESDVDKSVMCQNVLAFAISDEEKALLPAMLKTLGYAEGQEQQADDELHAETVAKPEAELSRSMSF